MLTASPLHIKSVKECMLCGASNTKEVNDAE